MADERSTDPAEDARADIERGEAADDEDRMRVLEELHRTLEDELERGVDEAGPPRR